MCQKTITTNRLTLRLFQQSDAPAVAHLCNNYNLYKSTLHLPYPYSVDDALAWIEHHEDHFNENKSYTFAITDKESGQLYGTIGLSYKQNSNNGELGYWIGEPFWGNGYATEAVEAIIQFAFSDKQYHRVYAFCFNSNPASGRVLEKVGMTQEGILIDHVKKENQYKDLLCYGLIHPSL
ncbi:GNAT family N-acetyltransferase [Lentibacillus saliphilus]|uniref:GNAT family N-acetyltransferase n=1 Tax=Lentibacillus saliphilus TaxID=2737028 RepID=UPI001C3081A2|nr:GNAT family N-acetyltransferase [Lentibacillus saliphilus]